MDDRRVIQAVHKSAKKPSTAAFSAVAFFLGAFTVAATVGCGDAVLPGGSGGANETGGASAGGGPAAGGTAGGSGGAPAGGAMGGGEMPGAGGSFSGGSSSGGSSSGGAMGGTVTGGAPAGGSGGSVMGTGTPTNRLDLVFMIDNSYSMAPLQSELVAALPQFMDALKDPQTGGLPDIHIGVISSDLGAGRSIVPGCARIGGDQGSFHNEGRNPIGCRTPTDPFIIDSIKPDGTRATNFGDGDITDVFSCIALIGDRGCGFESQFGSVLAALGGAGSNPGFLRPDAALAVVMLTNEDDCTAPPDSDLFNPNMTSPADPYGALSSYRCTEFGIACDQPLPHQAPATPVTLTNCRSKEDGRLLKVSDFVSQLKATKADPSKIFFGAIAALGTTGMGSSLAPVRQITIASTTVSTGAGAVPAPVLTHVPGCEAYAGDAALRIWDAVEAMNGSFASICQTSYANALTEMAKQIKGKLNGPCVQGKVAHDAAGAPSCKIAASVFSSATATYETRTLSSCAANGNVPPCWNLSPSLSCGSSGQIVTVDWGGAAPTAALQGTCEICLPGKPAPGCE
jgi:hypothetical protein